MKEYWIQYKRQSQAEHKASFPTFWRVWSSHYSFMRFRSTSSHAQCSECVKHKALISSLADHLNARKVQQDLLYTHLQAQFRDRSCYWRMRGLARARGLDVVCIQDGIDQSKFIVPRTSLMRAKTFEGFMRPKLHIVGVIAHGRHVAFYISEPNIPKDSNTSCEILADSLQRLAVAGVDLSACRVTLQADNTCREVKNGILMRYVASLVSDGVIGSGRLSFLRTGHSHEDIDQLFGRVASFIKLKVRTALTSSDFVHALEEFTRQLDRPFEPQRFVVKLDSIRDWRGWLSEAMPVSLKGIGGPRRPTRHALLQKG
ncbi:unnamed protein product [Durusdinium trenchii]|uniref:DUF7869 domain-containing protein n=1 Tax=Durusdinium trenchii TaxID=1381693 RepID=A0ABP0ND88_9DINO